MNLFTGDSVESIFSALKNYRDSESLIGLYVLIDRINGLPSVFEDILDTLPTSSRTPIVDASLIKYPEKALELVWLTEAEDEVLKSTVEYAFETSQAPRYGFSHSLVAGWLFSSDPARYLVRDCLIMMDQVNQNGEGVYFRAFDPRIRNALKRLTKSPLPGDIQGGALAWAYLDTNGSLLVDKSSPTSKLQLNPTIWKGLDRLTYLHPALMEWATQHKKHPDAEVVISADELIRRALDVHRLNNNEDIKTFVVYGLDAEPLFDQQSNFLEIIRNTLKEYQPLSEQLNQLQKGSSAPSFASTES